MKFRALSSRLIALCLAICVLHLPATRGAETWKQAAELTAFGLVKIDGELARSGQTLFSGSTIETSHDATSFINLGARGRLELLRDSSLSLQFDRTTLQGLLGSGRARITVAAGIRVEVATKDATVISDATQPAIFSVGFWNEELVVAVITGHVELREREGHVREVGAGQLAFVEDGAQAQSSNKKGTSKRKLAAILLPIGAALAILAFVFARGEDNRTLDFGGCVMILSPTTDPKCP
jgi:ferric-dicitrate binding protein FerR (iron transport regulator)